MISRPKKFGSRVILAMALLNSGDFGGLDSRNDESPCTTSSDDLFADINWPEDEADSPFDEGQFFIAMNSDHSTESPKVCRRCPAAEGGSFLTYFRTISITHQPTLTILGAIKLQSFPFRHRIPVNPKNALVVVDSPRRLKVSFGPGSTSTRTTRTPHQRKRGNWLRRPS